MQLLCFKPFVVASIMKKCEPYRILEQTSVNCSLMQIGILRNMTHKKDKHKLIIWIDQALIVCLRSSN